MESTTFLITSSPRKLAAIFTVTISREVRKTTELTSCSSLAEVPTSPSMISAISPTEVSGRFSFCHQLQVHARCGRKFSQFAHGLADALAAQEIPQPARALHRHFQFLEIQGIAHHLVHEGRLRSPQLAGLTTPMRTASGKDSRAFISREVPFCEARWATTASHSVSPVVCEPVAASKTMCASHTSL